MTTATQKRIARFEKALKTLNKSRALVSSSKFEGDITLEQIQAEQVRNIDVSIMVIEQRISMCKKFDA